MENKQELLTLIQSYATAFKSGDQYLLKLMTKQIQDYLETVNLVKIEEAN